MPETVTTGAARIADAFGAARAEGRAALMPYLVAGFPEPETSAAVADAYAEGGADLVELGVPFSDPLADGPVIHAAATRALAAGATLESALELCERIASAVPAVPMVYANMVVARGPAEFARLLADAGACGAIVPDLPLEESAQARAACDDAGVALVALVAPTTPDDRLAAIGASARGFVYTVSVTGTTGERGALASDLPAILARTKASTDVPVAVGFGIGTPEAAAAAADAGADGVIVGSRLVRAAAESDEPAAAVRELVAGFADALR
jgi:tryptophan synthase alpha chain